MILLHFPWKSAILHSLLSDSELSGIFFLSTVSSHRKMVFPLVFPLLIFHCLLRDIYTHIYNQDIYIYNQIVPAFCLAKCFLSGTLPKENSTLVPTCIMWASQEVGITLARILFRSGSFCAGKITKKSPTIAWERAMQDIYLKTLYNKLAARIDAIFTLS